MSNTFLTISMVTREALRILENNLKMAMQVTRTYDDKFGVAGAKIGNTLNIRKPARYVGGEGQDLTIENITETQVSLVLDKQFHVGIQFSSQDLALNIDDFGKRILAGPVATLANKIDFHVTGGYIDVANYVGTPGTVPTTLLAYLQLGQKLDEESCPMDDQRTLVINPAMQVNIVDQLKGLFQQSSAIAQQYATGRMGRAIGFEWMMDQNVRSHTVGQLGSTPLVNGANQSGTSLITDGWTGVAANRLKRGDCIEIGSGTTAVNAVNPMNYQSIGSTRKFVLTADADSDASGNSTLSIYPSMLASSAQQTVDQLPADNAAITTFGAVSTYASKVSPTGLAFHRDAFALGVADLPVPGGVDKGARIADDQLGISLRMIRDYTIMNDQFICRLDVLCGRVTQYAELAARIQG